MDDGIITAARPEIDGFDLIANGGLPRGRSTLVSGTSGQRQDGLRRRSSWPRGSPRPAEPGVFVTFEESPEDIRRNMRGFRLGHRGAGRPSGQWAFVDASPQPGEPPCLPAASTWGRCSPASSTRCGRSAPGGSRSTRWAASSPSSATSAHDPPRAVPDRPCAQELGRHVGHHRRAHRGVRPDLAVRRRGVRLRQRDRAPQHARGGGAAADGRDPQVPRGRPPEGRVADSRSCPARGSSSSRSRR